MNAVMSTEIEQIIKELKQTQQLLAEQKLVSTGFLDSFDVINLIDRLEKRFQITIGGEDFNLTNFDDIPSIVSLIQKLQEIKTNAAPN